jgi:hypothetical protein
MTYGLGDRRTFVFEPFFAPWPTVRTVFLRLVLELFASLSVLLTPCWRAEMRRARRPVAVLGRSRSLTVPPFFMAFCLASLVIGTSFFLTERATMIASRKTEMHGREWRCPRVESCRRELLPLPERTLFCSALFPALTNLFENCVAPLGLYRFS